MNNWPVVTLNDVFEIARGGSPRPIDDYITTDPGGVNWIMIGDAPEGAKYIERTKKRIRPDGAKRSRLVKPGDFLLSNSMSFGRPYIMKTSGCIHDGWLVLSPRRDDVDSDFLFRYLGSAPAYAELERRAAGATVKNLNIDVVSGVPIPLPPVAEQRRIADILDRADAMRAKRREAIGLLDGLRQSIFSQMFARRAQSSEWTVKPLASLVRPGDSINYGVVQPGGEVAGGVPMVRVGDIVNGAIERSRLKTISPSIDAQHRRSRLRGDEILVTCVGTIGVTALVKPSDAGLNIARAVARVPVDPSVNRAYLRAYLTTSTVQRYFASELRVVSQPTLNIKQLSETPVPLPDRQMQDSFASLVEVVDQLETAHRASLAEMDGLFASLQHRAFRGEL